MPTVNGIRRICIKANDGPTVISVETDSFRISTFNGFDSAEYGGRIYGVHRQSRPPEIAFRVVRWGGSEALAAFFRVNPVQNGFKICVEGFPGVKEFIIQSLEISTNDIGFPILDIVGNIYTVR